MMHEFSVYHSAKTKAPTTASTAVKPTLTEVEMPPLLFDELLVLLVVAPVSVPVSVADPLEPPELPDGVVELELELEFSALFRKAAKVLLAFALTANTIPLRQ